MDLVKGADKILLIIIMSANRHTGDFACLCICLSVAWIVAWLKFACSSICINPLPKSFLLLALTIRCWLYLVSCGS